MMDISIVIQAGGKSKRMGTDKGLVQFKSTTLIEYIIGQVKHLSSDLMIVSNKPDDYQTFGFPVSGDVFHDVGGLAGLHTGLINSKNEKVLMLGCDMPFHSLDLLNYMIGLSADFEIVIPKTGDGKYEPFRAIYSKTNLDLLEKTIKGGKRRMISILEHVNTREVSAEELGRFGDLEELFFNVNTSKDLEEAERINWEK